jgi:hypothetical protein
MCVDQVALGHLIVLGRPRLRQIRSEMVDCDMPSKYATIQGACFGGEDTRPFGPGSIWTWQSEDDLDGSSTWGLTNVIYPGSGFVSTLPSTRASNATDEFNALISQLQNRDWLDLASRAMFAEFVMYEPDHNFFVVGTVTFEFPESGGITASQSFWLSRLEPYNGEDSHLLGLEIATIFIIFGHAISEFQQVYT